jgi:hypothetical protein
MKWGKMTEIQPWDPMKFQPLLRKSEKKTQKKWVVGCQTCPTSPNDFTALVAPPRRIEIRPWRQWQQQSLPCPAATCQACPAKTKIGTIVYPLVMSK